MSVGVLALTGCNSGSSTSPETTSDKPGTTAKLTGAIKIDGSSTVYPITADVSEKFQDANSGVSVTVSESGTGGGIKKLIAGEIDICDASRPITEEEIAKAKEAGLEFLEIPLAYDGLTVVVNPKNTWADKLTVEELKKIWGPDSTVKTWADIRAGWPAEKIKLYGPGTASGTFDFFTEVIMGKKGSIRSDFEPSEDDNVLVKGVEGDQYAMAYFGIAYFEANMDKLRAVPIVNPAGEPTAPTVENVKSLKYMPLSRPLFTYVSKKAAARPEVQAFFEFYLGKAGQESVKTTGYVPFDAATYETAIANFKSGKTGSIFSGQTGKPVDEVLKANATGK